MSKSNLRKLRFLEIEASSVVQMESFDTHLANKIEEKNFEKMSERTLPARNFFS